MTAVCENAKIKEFCEKFYCKIGSDTCEKCKNDPRYVQDVLIPARVEFLEEKRRASKLGLVGPCKYINKKRQEERICCGGRKQMTDMVECGLYNAAKDTGFCQSCFRDKKYHICVSDNQRRLGCGIGDTLDALWVVEGLKEKLTDREVVFHTPHVDWANLAYDHNEGMAGGPSIHYMNRYSEELLNKECRIDSYAGATNCIPKKPALKFDKSFRVHSDEKYIVLAPSCAWPTRQWPIGSWIYLECIIREQLGISTVILDSKDQRGLFQGFCYWAQKPDIVCNIVHHALLTIAQDSMLSHLGGILDAKTIAIHSSLTHEHLFKYYPSVVSIKPKQGLCQDCFFQHTAGFRSGCDHGCWSLQTITPLRVFEEVKRAIATD